MKIKLLILSVFIFLILSVFIFQLNSFAQNKSNCPLDNIKMLQIVVDFKDVIFNLPSQSFNTCECGSCIDSCARSYIFRLEAWDEDSCFWSQLMCNKNVVYSERTLFALHTEGAKPIWLKFISPSGDTLKSFLSNLNFGCSNVVGKSKGWAIKMDSETTRKFKERIENVLTSAFKKTISSIRY